MGGGGGGGGRAVTDLKISKAVWICSCVGA